MSGIVAIARDDELPLGEPAQQHPEHLSHQLRRSLVPSLLRAVRFGGLVQDDQQGQGPSPGGPGDFDEHGQGDPLVPPAVGSEGMSGPDRVAMAALAVDVWARVLGDGVVAGQLDGALG